MFIFSPLLSFEKVRHGLLQIATGITKCDEFIINRDRYYKVRWLLQIATVHLSSRGWQVGRQSGAQPFNHAKQLVMLRLSSSRPIGNNFPCHYLHFLYYYYCCCCCCCFLWWNLFLDLLVLRLSISSLLQSATSVITKSDRTNLSLERPFMFR